MLRSLAGAAILLTLAGCTSAVTLRHPATGAVATCGPYYTVGLYAFAANERERQCIQDYQRQGYERTTQGPAPASSAATTQAAGTEGPGHLNGTYSGDVVAQLRGQSATLRLSFTLVQSGDHLVGTWSTSNRGSGTVSGTVSGSQITGFKARQLNPCPGEFTGAVTIERNAAELRGFYKGADCGGGHLSGFHRQPAVKATMADRFPAPGHIDAVAEDTWITTQSLTRSVSHQAGAYPLHRRTAGLCRSHQSAEQAVRAG